MATQQEVIKKFMAALDTHTFKRSDFKSDAALATKILDTAINKCSSFNSAQAVINQMLADCESYNAADSKNGWENFLLEKCGINLDNRDTGAITGADAGGSKVKTAESIVPEIVALKKFTGNYFNVKNQNLTVKLAKGGGKNANPVEISFNALNSDQQFIWQSLYTYWISGGLDLIAESYGNNFAFKSNSSLNTLYIIFDNNQNSSIRARTLSGPTTAQKCTIPLELHINMKYFSNLTGKNGGNSDGSAWYLDRTIAHELTHAVMMENVDYFFYLSQFIAEGMSDLTNGIDDTRKSYITALAKDSSLLESWLDVGDTTSNDNYVYAAGYMFIRYLARQASTQGKFIDNSTTGKKLTGGDYEDILKNSASNVTISGGKSNDYINNSGSNVSISGGDGADQIYTKGKKITVTTGKDDDFVYLYSSASNAKVVASSGNNEIQSEAQSATITAGTGNDYIEFYKKAADNILNTGDGKDTICDSGSNNSINAGSGNDYILLYSSTTKTTIKAGTGNDSIESYSTGVVYEYASVDGKDTISGFSAKDTLKVIDASFTTTTSSSNISVKVGSGSVILQNVKNTMPTIIMGVTNASNSSVTVGSSVKIIDASARTTAINLTGNELANSIVGGSQGDSIWGGAGKDTIFGNAGSDKLYGEAGNDILRGEAGNDSLRGDAGADSLWGGTGDDKLYGEDGNDFLSGDAGNDSLWGGANDDKLWGSDGSDRLDGEDGNDTLSGGSGNDILYGGKGNDSLWGNGGADNFVYTAGDGKDVIFGFEDSDTLTLDNLAFASSCKNNFVSLTFNDGGSITFKDFTASTFHIDKNIYSISGSKLKKQ